MDRPPLGPIDAAPSGNGFDLDSDSSYGPSTPCTGTEDDDTPSACGDSCTGSTSARNNPPPRPARRKFASASAALRCALRSSRTSVDL